MGMSKGELLKRAVVILKGNSSKEDLSKFIFDLKMYLTNNPNDKDVEKIKKLIREIERMLREKEIENKNIQGYKSPKNEPSKSRKR